MNQVLMKLRYRIEYAGFRLVAAVFGALPLETASKVSGAIWRTVAPMTARHPRALAQLGAAMPEHSRDEREVIVRAMWECMGRTFAEFFHLREIADSDRIRVHDPENLVGRFVAQGGFVACAAHQGNWEIAVMGLRDSKVKCAGLYQRIKNPYVDRWVRDWRAPFYPGGLYDKQPSSGLRLMRHVRHGQPVAIMVDLRDNTGVAVRFFGRNAPSTPFPAMLSRSLRVPMLVAVIVREPGVRFRIEVSSVETPHTSDRAADIEEATARLHAAFEASIRRNPSQWMWAHRRWG